MEIKELQYRVAKWREQNFPNQTIDTALLVVVEEVGELAHSQVKTSQQIRSNENHLENMEDAIGDIMIALLSYADMNGMNAERCVMNALQEVESRNWIKYPINGKTY